MLEDLKWSGDIVRSASATDVSASQNSREIAGYTQVVATAAPGHTLGEIVLPDGCLVATAIRAGQPTVPGTEFVLQPGDELLVIARHATDEEIRSAFQ